MFYFLTITEIQTALLTVLAISFFVGTATKYFVGNLLVNPLWGIIVALFGALGGLVVLDQMILAGWLTQIGVGMFECTAVSVLGAFATYLLSVVAEPDQTM